MSTKLKNILNEITWEGKEVELGKVYSNPYVNAFQQPTNEDTDPDSQMAVSQLSRSVDYAKMLIDKLKDKGDLEPWVQAKITKAEDYLNAVYGYYKGKENSDTE